MWPSLYSTNSLFPFVGLLSWAVEAARWLGRDVGWRCQLSQSIQLFSTVSRTRLVYSFMFSRYRLDASALAGELVLGSLSRLYVPPQEPLATQQSSIHSLPIHPSGESHRTAPRAHLWMLVNIAATSYVGLHRFCKMSRHRSPLAYTFGWNIWLTNLTVGGLLGYCSSNCMIRRKVPSSNGVSAGPMMTAFLLACERHVDQRRTTGRTIS